MTTITFDTLAFANKLKKAGCNYEQAEAQAEAVAELMSGMLQDHLATQRDLKDMESKLTVRFGVMLTTAVTVLSALLLILHN
jgi:hypothetical protein